MENLVNNIDNTILEQKNSGTTGELYWRISDYTLIISGNGAMPNYKDKRSEDISNIAPWMFLSFEEVVIEDGVTSIGDYAFYSYGRLFFISIPDSVVSIGDNALYCCNLESVTIPASVTYIAKNAFENCTSIDVVANNPNYISEDGVLFNKIKTVLMLYPNSKTDAEYAIPNSVIYIEDNAFNGSEYLRSVTIPDSVTSIGKSAFSLCPIKSVIIPNSVTSVEEGTFSYCRCLEEVTIPNLVTSIGVAAFYGCGLKTLSIPKSVEYIGIGAFMNCLSLSEIINHAIIPQANDPKYFNSLIYARCVLRVHSQAISAYQEDVFWKNFKNIERI